MNSSEPILVAIHCLVYNHEPYIRDCLEGFVMQKTNFRFVAIVHDDVSTDGSAAIIREYAEKYPDIFMPIFETENQWSKQDGSLTRIMYDAIVKTGAKYVAMCEGDDYWINPHKLQKQVDYMELHPNCTLCAHNSLQLNTATRAIDLFNKKLLQIQDYTLDTFITKDWFTPTQTLLYRRSSYQLFENLPEFKHGDYSLQVNLLLAPDSYLHYENDIMSVYRMGGWASINFNDLDLLDDSISLLEFYKEKSNHRCDELFSNQIEVQFSEKERYAKHIIDIKKSNSLYVRIGHGLSRLIVAIVNKYVKCLYISKRI